MALAAFGPAALSAMICCIVEEAVVHSQRGHTIVASFCSATWMLNIEWLAGSGCVAGVLPEGSRLLSVRAKPKQTRAGMFQLPLFAIQVASQTMGALVRTWEP